MRRMHLVFALLVTAAVGFAAGYLYRRHTAPTLEESARDLAEDVRKAAEGAFGR